MSLIGREVERHAVNKALYSNEGESILHEIRTTGESFVSGVQTWMLITGIVLLLLIFIVWNFVGKGQGSHAGREEVRRSYRRALAREMAKQDAEKIRRGEKERKRWMQW